MAKVKSTEAGLALPTGENISDMVKFVAQQRQAYKKLEELPWKTGKIYDDGRNLDDVTKIEDLVIMHASITARANAYNESAKKFFKEGTEFAPFKVKGATPEQWEHDLLKRSAMISQQETDKKMAEIEQELKKFVSEAELKEQAIAKAAKFFSEFKLGQS